jgi:simple sugar transport system permease protein
VLLAFAAVAVAWWVLFRTRFGLRLRSVGEHPEAAATLGLSVTRLRYAGVLWSGALAALGGAWLASDQRSFTDAMSAGRGYIALAAMIVGKWNPLGAAAACLLFGAAETLQIRLQGEGIPNEFLQMLPYAVTMAVLAGAIGRARPPASVGRPYDPEAGG